MNQKLLFLAAASFLLMAPVVQHQVFGMEQTTTVVIQKPVQSDADIKLAVKNAISSDKELANYVNKINISVDKGVVTLGGEVNSSIVKSNIESKAKAVLGVNKVVDNIVVKSVEVKS